MTASGELRPWTAYLMGCHSVPAELYRHQPAVMLYVPLRTLIYIDSADWTGFAVDQPSTLFSGFADPAVAAAGIGLDRQLADLLGALSIQAGPLASHAGPVLPAHQPRRRHF